MAVNLLDTVGFAPKLEYFKGFEALATNFAMIARLYDQGIMPFIEGGETIRPADILEKIQVLAATDLSTTLTKALKVGIIEKRAARTYALDVTKFRVMCNYRVNFGFPQNDSPVKMWKSAAERLKVLTTPHGWAVCCLLWEKKMNVGDLVHGVNTMPEVVALYPAISPIQQPSMTQLLKRLRDIGIIRMDMMGKFKVQSLQNRALLSFMCRVAAQYAGASEPAGA